MEGFTLWLGGHMQHDQMSGDTDRPKCYIRDSGTYLYIVGRSDFTFRVKGVSCERGRYVSHVGFPFLTVVTLAFIGV